eukprot:Platyproteum_vivax@DN3450_c0_g1_i1.p1
MLDMAPVDFFKEELRTEDIAMRIQVVHKVKLVAAAIGPAKVLSDLLPFLKELASSSEDDELLHALGQEALTLADLVGGDGNLYTLLPLLEQLAIQEETVVREKAVETICALCERVGKLKTGQAAFAEPLTQVVLRLTHDWFTSRVSACSLLPHLYAIADPATKSELKKRLIGMCADETPMVRRAAASKMSEFFKRLEKGTAAQYTDLINTLTTLSNDETQDSIRAAAVEAAIELSRKITPEDVTTITLPLIMGGSEDRSWRVRLVVASHIHEAVTAIGLELTTSTLLPSAYVKLLKDEEGEVRITAVMKLDKLCACVPGPTLRTIVGPHLTKLHQDSSQAVRASLSNVLGAVATHLGQEFTKSNLVELALELMKDTYRDVRLQIVGHIGQICEVLGVEGINANLLTTLQGLVVDNQWRIRLLMVTQIPSLAKLFGPEMFQTKLEEAFLSSLTDSVHSVREATINSMQKIAETFGTLWTVEHLLPKIVEQYSSQQTSYAHRITLLHVLPQLGYVMSPEQVISHLVPVVLQGLKDTVPNVRFVAANTAASIVMQQATTSTAASEKVATALKPKVVELLKDSDVDVRYFTAQSLAQFPGYKESPATASNNTSPSTATEKSEKAAEPEKPPTTAPAPKEKPAPPTEST